jgi:hypothetical protein
MSDILNNLFNVSGPIETGIVTAFLGDRKYTVTISGQDHTVKSAVSSSISVGNLAVVNKTPNGRYIIGVTPKSRLQLEKEVIVDG